MALKNKEVEKLTGRQFLEIFPHNDLLLKIFSKSDWSDESFDADRFFVIIHGNLNWTRSPKHALLYRIGFNVVKVLFGVDLGISSLSTLSDLLPKELPQECVTEIARHLQT